MKKKLKQKILEKRDALSDKIISGKSSKIMKKLFSLPEFKKAKNILFYVSFNNEVDTCNAIKKSINKKNIIVPVTDKKNRKLILSKLSHFEDLENGCFGILEPKKRKIKKINKKDIDLVIVPGIVFDVFGHRIGYGHGYYDRFLKTLNKIPLIGLAYEFQVIAKIPAESHDVPVYKIITEKKVIKVKR